MKQMCFTIAAAMLMTCTSQIATSQTANMLSGEADADNGMLKREPVIVTQPIRENQTARSRTVEKMMVDTRRREPTTTGNASGGR